MIGTHLDLEDDRQVPFDLASHFVEQHQFHFFECSSKTDEKVFDIIEFILEQYYIDSDGEMIRTASEFKKRGLGTKMSEYCVIN